MTKYANIGEARTKGAEVVATYRPDVVLLDLKMPGLDGFQICRTIKADPDTSKTIVIAMTGYYSSETEARILECGAIRCFSKPVELPLDYFRCDRRFHRPADQGRVW